MRYEQDFISKVYSAVCSHDGVTAREIARELGVKRKDVNQVLYGESFVRDLCYCDEDYRWHGLIRQAYPHEGIYDFSGWYGTVRELRSQSENEWLAELEDGCRRIGRNLNNERGLLHSFTDARLVMLELFHCLQSRLVDCDNWETCFELRIKREKWVRIYADTLVIAPGHAFSLEFKMKDEVDQAEVDQAAKYTPYLSVLLGPEVEVIPALILTRAEGLYSHVLAADGNTVTVASREMLLNVFDEELCFLG